MFITNSVREELLLSFRVPLVQFFQNPAVIKKPGNILIHLVVILHELFSKAKSISMEYIYVLSCRQASINDRTLICFPINICVCIEHTIPLIIC